MELLMEILLFAKMGVFVATIEDNNKETIEG